MSSLRRSAAERFLASMSTEAASRWVRASYRSASMVPRYWSSAPAYRPAPPAPLYLDDVLGLEDAERLPQGRAGHAVPLDQRALRGKSVTLAQFTGDNLPPELLGDEFPGFRHPHLR